MRSTRMNTFHKGLYAAEEQGCLMAYLGYIFGYLNISPIDLEQAAQAAIKSMEREKGLES